MFKINRGVANHIVTFLVLLSCITSYVSAFSKDLPFQDSILDISDEVVEVSGKSKRNRKSKQHNSLIELDEEEIEEYPMRQQTELYYLNK
jgi:hypothetical protein